MPKAYLPDNFQTELDSEGTVPVFRVTVPDSDDLYVINLRYLSDKLLNGERIDAGEKAVAGAALSHLIAVAKNL